MPITTVNWLIATLRPRIFAGDISAMYIGLNIEAIPTLIPAAERIVKKTGSDEENAMPNDEAVKMRAAVISPGLRPRRSESLPAIRQPTIQPRAREPVKNPSETGVSPNAVRRKGRAPEITAKSKPNKYPPNADIKDIPRMYLLL